MIMKKILKKIAPVAMAALLVWGCEKDENKVMFENGTNPVLSTTTTAPALLPGKEKEVAMILSWTNPNYRFNTGISSHDVQYRLEFDTAGSNFTNPNKGIVVVSRDLSRSFTVDDMNALFSGANGMKLTPDKEYNFEVRAVSTIGSVAVPLTSNVIKFKAKPFTPPPAVELPTSGRLFLVGDASPGGWDNPVPANQEFTKATNTRYEITVKLTGGKSMLMLPVNGSWADKYGWDGGNNSNNPDGDKLKRGGGDIKVPAADGTYKIVADFQNGRFTITKQ
jgi:hypothetical protein